MRSPRGEELVERRDRLPVDGRVVVEAGASRDGPPPGDLEVQPASGASAAPPSTRRRRREPPRRTGRTVPLADVGDLHGCESIGGRPAGSIVRRSGDGPTPDEIDRRTRRGSALPERPPRDLTGSTTSSSAGRCSNPAGTGPSTSSPSPAPRHASTTISVCACAAASASGWTTGRPRDRPDTVFDIPPGHDGWVIGDEPWETYDFAGMRAFARTIEPDDRVLASILFTDVVDSTATAERLGDTRWRETHLGPQRAHANPRWTAIAAAWSRRPATASSPCSTTRSAPCVRLVACDRRCPRARPRAACRRSIPARSSCRRATSADWRSTWRRGSSASPGDGDVYVSGSTYELLAGSSFTFEDRGEQELKGVSGVGDGY